jgi:peroxiredoxin Q/BCP
MTDSPAPGQPAPDFALPRDGGGTVRLSDLRGKPVVLYVYPEDNTTSCTKEAQGFTALADDFAAAGATVLGLSPDSVAKHDKFRTKYDLKVPLLADEDRAVINAYGLWVEKSMYGKTYMGVERATFLIDATGTIARVWHKVRVNGHPEEVLAAVRAL